ncbi:hypothetical protein RSOLAG1IB_07059 [Rhizoctonia solani AG-1 IB]|uniref:Uncharacterized protein n=1 Tax=Thanatephorus cucumeris (strain AG1-IB / isolate 7/3/14) TaxID=1108050 RepID=A0A0B7F8Q2_THACB|nr:hypothetical protein RSOLAG1IB_07059 [Rhizoctonia solani AG-1 IB]
MLLHFSSSELSRVTALRNLKQHRLRLQEHESLYDQSLKTGDRTLESCRTYGLSTSPRPSSPYLRLASIYDVIVP